MPHDITLLADRRIVAVEGAEARSFLQRLLTNDVEGLAPGQARYAALLTPQGKLMADMVVVRAPSDESLLLDVPAATAPGLARALTLYRLRAKVAVINRSDGWDVAVFTGEAPADAILAYADPRGTALWRRAIVPAGSVPADAEALARFHAARIEAGVPEGGTDFAYGEVFPHDVNLDLLGGVDFAKGCYVGQEVVSRTHHRGTARKRVVPAAFEGAPPPPGAEIRAGAVAIGTMGSAAGGRGLALVRVDRAAEASEPPSAAGVALRLALPATP